MESEILRIMNAGKLNISKNKKRNKNIAIESLQLLRQLNDKNRL